MTERVRYIAAGRHFAQHLGIEVVSIEVDRVVLRLPYQEYLGIDRVDGGAIASLVDLAGTCACWSNPVVSDAARGATVDHAFRRPPGPGAFQVVAQACSVQRKGRVVFREVPHLTLRKAL